MLFVHNKFLRYAEIDSSNKLEPLDTTVGPLRVERGIHLNSSIASIDRFYPVDGGGPRLVRY